LGLSYLDTGAMYRAATWAVLQNGASIEDPGAMTQCVGAAQIISGTDPAHPSIIVDGVNVADAIRGPRVSAAVSAVSAVPEIRALMVDRQRAYVAEAFPGIVVEGRDIGTVVLPDAPTKVFLTASPEVRAQRRAHQEQQEHQRAADVHSTEAALRERDAKDSTRAVSPLTPADDAVVLDTSNMTFDEVVDAIISISAERA
jgi:cytidylate kinase